MASSHPALDLQFAPGPGVASLQDLLYAELDAFEPVAIGDAETGDGWRVFFRAAGQRDAARDVLSARFGSALLAVVAVDVDDEDWARRSQAGLKAISVGRVVVAPPWDLPDTTAAADTQADASEIVVVIEPSMGFGTGHHATTQLCLELLQEADVRGRRVVDVGTGSGVLAIAAAKLGAASVTAIDHDSDAVANARENAAHNGVAIDLYQADLARVRTAPADLVLANLTGPALQRGAAALVRLLAPGGEIIVSGCSPDELSDVASAFGGHPIREIRDGDWAAARLRF